MASTSAGTSVSATSAKREIDTRPFTHTGQLHLKEWAPARLCVATVATDVWTTALLREAGENAEAPPKADNQSVMHLLFMYIVK
mmetsp:Transcript_23614/g.55955  ORF Transcript_23614/g.55955 Transcript_23614/m.55955 type:complete len:84 (+) Transcript_23614:960-1211(+)